MIFERSLGCMQANLHQVLALDEVHHKAGYPHILSSPWKSQTVTASLKHEKMLEG